MAQAEQSDTSHIILRCPMPLNLVLFKIPIYVIKQHSKAFDSVIETTGNTSIIRENIYSSSALPRIIEHYCHFLSNREFKLEEQDQGDEIRIIFELYRFAEITDTPLLRKILVDRLVQAVNNSSSPPILRVPTIGDIKYLYTLREAGESRDLVLITARFNMEKLKTEHNKCLRQPNFETCIHMEQNEFLKALGQYNRALLPHRRLFPLLVAHFLHDSMRTYRSLDFNNANFPEAFVREVATHLMSFINRTKQPRVTFDAMSIYDPGCEQLARAENQAKVGQTQPPSTAQAVTTIEQVFATKPQVEIGQAQATGTAQTVSTNQQKSPAESQPKAGPVTASSTPGAVTNGAEKKSAVESQRAESERPINYIFKYSLARSNTPQRGSGIAGVFAPKQRSATAPLVLTPSSKKRINDMQPEDQPIAKSTKRMSDIPKTLKDAAKKDVTPGEEKPSEDADDDEQDKEKK